MKFKFGAEKLNHELRKMAARAGRLVAILAVNDLNRSKAGIEKTKFHFLNRFRQQILQIFKTKSSINILGISKLVKFHKCGDLSSLNDF